ncbi:MAG: hypothetical protein LQ342_000618 [Letrouitia transgressa]|nr:MAG: hypothetical protein LQ342_000618 [Letrouitia transgressa]
MSTDTLSAAKPASQHDVLKQFRQEHHAALKAGIYEPFVWPYRALGLYLLIFYLLSPPSKSQILHFLRYPLFLFIVYFCVSTALECRSPAITIGYGNGLLNAWTILWSATLLLFNDARRDFKRIEKQEVAVEAEPIDITPVENSQGHTSALDGTTSDGLKSLHPVGDIPQPPPAPDDKPQAVVSNEIFGDQTPIPPDVPQSYVYQPLPSTFLHRLDWVLDLTLNFRGLRWTHQIPGTYPPPPWITAHLDPSSSPPPPSSSKSTYPTRTSIIRSAFPTFILNALSLDLLKTLASYDPYFATHSPSAHPSPFPLPRLTRLTITLLLTYTSLQNIVLLSPLVLNYALGPRILGAHASPWLYPPYFGPLSALPESGLPGFWGTWWHQIFRCAFSAAGSSLSTALAALNIIPHHHRKPLRTLTTLLTAFVLSGLLHASASSTLLSPRTRPRNSFLFFAVQPAGILAQRAASAWLAAWDISPKFPGWARRSVNVAVVVGWALLTGPLIADEFAGGGIWLYEPLPLSLGRGLKGDGWWRWGRVGEWVGWWWGDRWWKSGVVFLEG